MVLAIATGETYRQRAFDSQQQDFIQLAKLKVNDLLEKVVQDTKDLGISVQSNPDFVKAVRAQDPESLSKQLDQHFFRAFVTLNVLKLSKLYVLDTQLQLLAASSEGDPNLADTSFYCDTLVHQAGQRKGPARLKPMSRLCIIKGKPYLTAIVPVGGLHLRGYVMLAVDPVKNLAAADVGLGTPVRVLMANDIQVFESKTWPKLGSENILLTKYILRTPENDAFLQFVFASDISRLIKQLSQTRNFILGAASVAMLLTAAFAFWILQHTVLNPLGILTHHLRRLRNDKSLLEERLEITGNAEISELAEDFNNMSDELHTLYKTLETMAFTDALTGLANRSLFYDRLQRAILTADRNNSQLAIFIMDLDRFKSVNDTLGHHVGDQLLLEVAQRLESILRKSDTVARLGGDEFAALLPAVENERATIAIAQKIIETLNKPIVIEGYSLSVGVSIGMVRYPKDGSENNKLLQRADIAMYHAKRNGLGYAFYSEEMDSDKLSELTLEADLRKAIENNQLEVYFQPKINMARSRISGVEALLRWEHDEHGFIPPDKFVALAEQTGLIQSLTRWVLNAALAQCAYWASKGKYIGVSVNLSAQSLTDNSTINMIRHALENTKVMPSSLTLELTETAVMTDAAKALEILMELDKMGVRLSIDDFGTGYSSLAYLKRLPVDEIKIDKAFVMDMSDDVNDAVIVRSTIDLAHNMGLSVVAEGVETQEIWNMLSGLGCNVGQGYFMCRPSSADDIDRWIEESPWGLQKERSTL